MKFRTLSGSPDIDAYLDEVRATLTGQAFGDKVIYTTLFGHSDTPKQPARAQPGWDLVCLTDRRDLAFGAWTPVFIDRLHRDPRRTARLFKILPWVVFPEVEQSLFLDASIRITGSVDEFIGRYCARADLSCLAHPTRDCTYVEAQECIKRGKEEARTVETQMASYRRQGFPADAGLIASGVILRRHASEDMRALMTRWADEVNRHSARDQLSFNYSAWATGTRYNSIPLNIFDNPYFDVVPHARVPRFDREGRDAAGIRDKAGHWILKAKYYARRSLERLRELIRA